MNPFTQNNPYPFHSLTELSVFVAMEAYKIYFNEKITMCKKLIPFEILNVLWKAYLL